METKRMAGLLAVVAIVMLVVSAVAAMAQSNDNMEVLREKLRADKKLVVAENMQLTEEEGKRFWPIYDAYQKEKSTLADRRIKIIEDYAAHYETLSDDVANDLVNRNLAAQKDALKLMESYLPKISKVVGAIKAARFYQIENKIDAALNYGLAANIPLAQ